MTRNVPAWLHFPHPMFIAHCSASCFPTNSLVNHQSCPNHGHLQRWREKFNAGTPTSEPTDESRPAGTANSLRLLPGTGSPTSRCTSHRALTPDWPVRSPANVRSIHCDLAPICASRNFVHVRRARESASLGIALSAWRSRFRSANGPHICVGGVPTLHSIARKDKLQAITTTLMSDGSYRNQMANESLLSYGEVIHAIYIINTFSTSSTAAYGSGKR